VYISPLKQLNIWLEEDDYGYEPRKAQKERTRVKLNVCTHTSSSVLARGAKKCLFKMLAKSRYRKRGERNISEIMRALIVLIRSIFFSPIVAGSANK
jgi:hypothetical protein